VTKRLKRPIMQIPPMKKEDGNEDFLSHIWRKDFNHITFKKKKQLKKLSYRTTNKSKGSYERN
jgi:hypothetical protein